MRRPDVSFPLSARVCFSPVDGRGLVSGSDIQDAAPGRPPIRRPVPAEGASGEAPVVTSIPAPREAHFTGVLPKRSNGLELHNHWSASNNVIAQTLAIRPDNHF
jgi:hypothetical protein